MARDEADDLSDLDINIYVDGTQAFSANRAFAGEMIQIHVQPLPTLAGVRESTWGYRFLKEAGIVLDPQRRYESFAREALCWLDSDEGRNAMRSGALADISDRKAWAERAIVGGDSLGAGMASVAAMTDAAMFHRATISQAMANGTPLADLGSSYPTAPDVPWQHICMDDAEALLNGFAAYRLVLEEKHGQQEDFILDQIQVDMTRRKVDRILRQGDAFRLGETLYHTTFWLMRTRGDRPFADHLACLPDVIVAPLRAMGFDEPSTDTVDRRLSWTDDVCAACARRVDW